MQVATVGLDIAKQVFQVHGRDLPEGLRGTGLNGRAMGTASLRV